MRSSARNSRQASLRRVMETVIRSGSVSRAGIRLQTGLSSQTISEITGTLERDGWICRSGQPGGHDGRVAATYEVVPDAAGIAAIDLGGTKTRVAISDMSCRVVAEAVEPTHPGGGRDVIAQIADLFLTAIRRENMAPERVRLAVAGVPGVPNPGTGRITMSPNVPGLDALDFASELERLLRMEVVTENDVNLAVLGEHWVGTGRDVDNLALIALGTGIGAGLVLNGQLILGHRGSAGEIGFLPLGKEARLGHAAVAGALEASVGSLGIRLRYHSLSGQDRDIPEIFELADDGDGDARAVLDETSALLAEAILAVCAVVSPAMVILGGSIGSREELVHRVRKRVDAQSVFDVDIRPSILGPRAGIAGATAMGLSRLHRNLFGIEEDFDSCITLPPGRVPAMDGNTWIRHSQ